MSVTVFDFSFHKQKERTVNGIGRMVSEIAAGFIVLGGLHDVFVPKLPANLMAMCEGNVRSQKLIRELLRALGAALVAIGAAVGLLVNVTTAQNSRGTLMIVFGMVVVGEGVNAFSMYKVGSPFYVPLAFWGQFVRGDATDFHSCPQIRPVLNF